MKYIFYLMLAFLLIACNQAPETTASEAPENTTSAAPKIVGSAASTEKPPTDMRETAILVSKIWVFEHWYDIEVPDRDKDQIGRWYRFSEDGTFVGGHWENQNDEGSWFLKKGDPHNIILIDSAIDDLKDGEWEIQRIDHTEKSLTWVKTKNRGDDRPVLGQLNILPDIPSKVQFGIQ